MSQSYGSGIPATTSAADGGASGKVDTAKAEASDLKDTTVSKATDVASTVKGEASSVLGEAGTQAKQLYAQTQRELKEQASAQQQRLASGLRSVGSELESMSANGDQQGVAADLVRQAATRISGAASWLGDRDPGSVLNEVKSYARRKPGMFIAGAAIAGVVVGRLTRALAANASDDKAAQASMPAVPATPAPVVVNTTTPVPPAPVAAPVDTPLYEQSTATHAPGLAGEGGQDVRRDTI
ncbi:hypothetical protein [Microbacterium jiangjiandongii]|uniref:hypothetical protein n=1 Tax=Microbacterium jiangjiandongii TaxID=3049071 RepID=UPI00214AD538|nr:hypothetical protein [Microbacterium sp. zg.Y843]MCR2817173.1 hypothetical protein [Microbacterium sp. zg.Y843]